MVAYGDLWCYFREQVYSSFFFFPFCSYVLFLCFYRRFFDATTSEFTAPSDSDAQEATDALVDYFPAQKDIHTCVVWVGLNNAQTTNSSSTNNDAFANSFGEGGGLYDQGLMFDTLLREKVERNYGNGDFLKNYVSYYTMMNVSLPDLAVAYIQNP